MVCELSDMFIPQTFRPVFQNPFIRIDGRLRQPFGLNENHSFMSYGSQNIAGAGLEPATFGL